MEDPDGNEMDHPGERAPDEHGHDNPTYLFSSERDVDDWSTVDQRRRLAQIFHEACPPDSGWVPTADFIASVD
jgi:hypothetical protein